MTTAIASSRLPLAGAAAAALLAFAAGVVAAPVLTKPLTTTQGFVQDTTEHDRRGARDVVLSDPTDAMMPAMDPINQRGARTTSDTVPTQVMTHGVTDETPRARLAAR